LATVSSGRSTWIADEGEQLAHGLVLAARGLLAILSVADRIERVQTLD
jgi:hypothetical protein